MFAAITLLFLGCIIFTWVLLVLLIWLNSKLVACFHCGLLYY